MLTSKPLTIIFISISALVTAGLIWQAYNFVDALHNNLQATKNIHIKEDNKVPERGRFDNVSKEFADRIENLPNKPFYKDESKPRSLIGSEINYQKAKQEVGLHHYAEASRQATLVLQKIPEEAQEVRIWFVESRDVNKAEYLAMTYQMRAICYIKLADYKSAVKDLDQAIMIDPNSSVSYYNRANAYKSLGRDLQSRSDFDRAKLLRSHNQ